MHDARKLKLTSKQFGRNGGHRNDKDELIEVPKEEVILQENMKMREELELECGSGAESPISRNIDSEL